MKQETFIFDKFRSIIFDLKELNVVKILLGEGDRAYLAA